MYLCAYDMGTAAGSERFREDALRMMDLLGDPEGELMYAQAWEMMDYQHSLKDFLLILWDLAEMEGL
jgi:hypothetical protein